MAQIQPPPIQVPQTNPNPGQAVNPFPLANAYLDRQSQAWQNLHNNINDAGTVINDYHQQKIRNQMAALAAYSNIAGSSGITAANQMAPGIPGGMNTQYLPTDPFQDNGQGNTPSAVPAGGVGGGSGNAGGQGTSYGGVSQGTPQPQQPPVSQGSPQTLPQGQPQQPSGPSPYIAASVAAGAPDITGHMAKYQPAQLTSMAPQMAQNNAEIARASHIGGSYAANRVKSLSEANTGLAAQQTAVNAPEMYNATQANEERRFQQGKNQEQANFNTTQANEKNKGIAGEISKQGADSQQIGDLQTLAQTMQKSLGTDLGIAGNIKGDIYQLSGGRKGSSAAANLQNATIPLATGLNTVLSHRFNAGEVAALGQSLIPQPKDTPQYQQQKLQNLSSLLNVMATGNEQNVKNVAAAIMGGKIPTVGIQQNQPQANPQIHNAAIQWAQANPNDPRAKAVLAKAQASIGGNNGI